MKIAKKEIREFVSDIRDTEKMQGWKFNDAGAYIKDNKVRLFNSYKGEGVDSNVFNNTCKEIINFDDIIKGYLSKECTLQYTTEIIYDNINEMIEDYKIENEVKINNNIAAILKEKALSIRKMSIDLEMDYSITHALVKRESLSTTTLERLVNVSDYLQVDIKDLYK